MAINKRCPVCQKFFRTIIQQRKYCSDKCARSRKYYTPNIKKEKHCKKCGKAFLTGRPDKEFCSAECRWTFHKTYIIKNKVCAECGKPFVTTTNRKKYCGKECYKKAKQRRDKNNYANKL